MAHALAVRNGKHQYYGAKLPAWHRLGTTTNEAQKLKEVLEMVPALAERIIKQQIPNPLTGEPSQFYAVMSEETKNWYGTVKKSYTVLQVEEAMEFMDTLIEAKEGAYYETAGVLGEGEKYWFLVKLTDNFDVVSGDTHETYLLCINGHDGQTKLTFKLTATRVVCANTLAIAENDNYERLVLKHTTGVKIKLDEAKQLIQGEQMNAENMKLKLQELSRRKLTVQNVAEVLGRLIPKTKGTDDYSGKSVSKIEEIVKLYALNDNNQFPSIQGTAYNLLNAITEYTDHCGGVRRTTSWKKDYSEEDLRATASLFGVGAMFKEHALDIILQQTDGCERIIQPSIGRMFVPMPSAKTTTGSSLLDDIADSTIHQA